MDQMAKELGLRRRGNRWIYRRRVPQDLRAVLGKREIKESLQTEVYAEAKVKRNATALKWDRSFSQLRRRLSFEQLRSDIIRHVAEQSKSRNKVSTVKEEDVEIPRHEARADIRLYQDNPDSDEAQDQLGRLKQSIFSSLAIQSDEMPVPEFTTPDVTSHLSEDQASEVNELLRQAALELAMRDFDVLHNSFPSQGHNRVFATASPVTLKRATDEFLTEHFTRNLTPKREQSLRAEASMVLFILGQEMLLSEITRLSCRNFRDTINQLPSNITKHFPDYDGMNLEQIVAEARRKALPRMKRQTQAKYITMLKSILGFAEKENYITSNPAYDLTPLGEKVPRKKARNAFQTEGLTKIFRADHFASRSNTRAERFWCPLIALFTGMRLNEICQLDISDVKRSTSGVWYIDINVNDETKNVKNELSERKVPVHSELKKLGFLSFVDMERKRCTSGKLFEGIKRTDVTNYGASVSKWFNRFLRNTEVKSPKNSFHSFRHNFKDALSRARIYQDFIDALGGWNTIRSGSSGSYGDAPSLDDLATEIEKVSYPGLDLSHLYRAEGPSDPS
jgi:integrase